MLTGLSLTVLAGPALAAGDPVRGEAVFSLCSGCHALVGTDKIGPPLGGVVGRKAGSVAAVHYSSAMTASHLVWTPATLDGFLAAPRTVVPGSLMSFSLVDPQQRADVIAYLERRP
jgi:cytochrome c